MAAEPTHFACCQPFRSTYLYTVLQISVLAFKLSNTTAVNEIFEVCIFSYGDHHEKVTDSNPVAVYRWLRDNARR